MLEEMLEIIKYGSSESITMHGTIKDVMKLIHMFSLSKLFPKKIFFRPTQDTFFCFFTKKMKQRAWQIRVETSMTPYGQPLDLDATMQRDMSRGKTTAVSKGIAMAYLSVDDWFGTLVQVHSFPLGV